MPRVVTSLLVVLSTALLTGCPDWQGNVELNRDDGEGARPLVALLPGEQAPEFREGIPTPSAELPADFPRDVPLYEDATLAASAFEGNGYHLEFLTDDDALHVMRFYHVRLRDFGWYVSDIHPGLLQPKGEVAAKKEDRLFTLVCRELPGQTRVMLTVAEISPDSGS
jgi:hypothetical protein